MIIALIVNYSVREDKYGQMEVIAHLWPCYGLIALTFVFFAAGTLIFMSTACNHFTGDDDYDSRPNYFSND
jgi:hypothetical protein